MPVVGYDLVIKATNTGLMFADQHRLKAATAVSWGGYLKIACVTSDGLFSVPVTLIRFIRLFMLGIAEMVFHLSL